MMTITVDPRSFAKIRGIQNIVKRLPDGVTEASSEFGKSLQKRVKRNTMVKRLVWKGNLHESVKWHQKKSIGWLSMASYGSELENQRPTMKVVDRRMRLWSWAHDPAKHRGAGVSEALLTKIYLKQPIRLRQYDVYSGAFRRTLADLPGILQRHVRKVAQSRGK